MSTFLNTTPTANFIFYRSYSRWTDKGRETWTDTTARCVDSLIELGKLTKEEGDLLDAQMYSCTALPSGRYMWCGGTEWSDKQQNYAGQYNCTSTVVDKLETFGYLMDLAMQGTGTGAILELDVIDKLPKVANKLNIEIVGEVGTKPKQERRENTFTTIKGNKVSMAVGDSRRGWVESYNGLIQLACTPSEIREFDVSIDLSSVRPSGEKLKGFGGTANPAKLSELYGKVAKTLNGAIGRKMTSIECCKLIDEAALVVVAGNIRRSAGMRQFCSNDVVAATAKDNLWIQSADGKWSIDPERDALRMSNHTRVFHTKPTLDDCIESVRKQYYSGEGAIQWAGEAVARSNADLLNTGDLKQVFLDMYSEDRGVARDLLKDISPKVYGEYELNHRIARYGLNPCGEIIGTNFFCNLSEVHLNTIDPFDFEGQQDAFKAASLAVVSLLHHQFELDRYKISRKLDPIIGVSFTGLFDFFVNLFGIEWLQWWQAGRPDSWGAPTDTRCDVRMSRLIEANFIKVHHYDNLSMMFKAVEEEYLAAWKAIVFDTVNEYCDRHDIKAPNRCTTVQPAGSKSLLTGASPGWHPPKAPRYIRRMTFGKGEAIALAAMDMGYNVIPSQSDKDELGNLLDDPFDPRVTEWLVEIPCAVDWADVEGVNEIDFGKFSALAQFDFYMQVQKHYTTHNTSATIELQEHEIEILGARIYESIQSDEGYISSALLARFESLETFPRMPFEPIGKETYDSLCIENDSKAIKDSFDKALARYDQGQVQEGASGCDSDKCTMPERKPE